MFLKKTTVILNFIKNKVAITHTMQRASQPGLEHVLLKRSFFKVKKTEPTKWSFCFSPIREF